MVVAAGLNNQIALRKRVHPSDRQERSQARNVKKDGRGRREKAKGVVSKTLQRGLRYVVLARVIVTSVGEPFPLQLDLRDRVLWYSELAIWIGVAPQLRCGAGSDQR